LSASASFDEEQSNAGEQNIDNDLLEADNFAVNFDAEYRLSPKFSVGSGVRYSEKQYVTYQDLFADREGFTIPVDVFYEWTPKVDLSFGYAYTETAVGGSFRQTGIDQFTRTGAYDRSSHFFNIGARGDLLPKLAGFFKVGYRARSTDDLVRQNFVGGIPQLPTSSNRDDSGMLGLDADLRWSATPKLSATLSLSRDFGVGGEGQSTENTSINLSANYAISTQYSAYANFGYTLRDYSNADREDDQYLAGIGLAYSPNQHWRFSVGYDYSENESNDVSRSYENHGLNLNAILRY
jgi:hypothetical protein